MNAEFAIMGGVTLPSGTLTFLLSDVEGSTRLWEVEREAMAVALPRSLQLVEDVASSYGGVLPVEQGEGDSRLAVFPRAADALTAAVAIQRAMAEQPWPDGAALRVRIAVHAGDARLRDERTYGGGVVHRAARLRALARGGQVLVSRAVHDLVADELPVGMELVDLGRHRLRDLSRPEEVFELRHPDLAVVEGGLRSLAAVPNNLPSPVSSFVGRADERAELGGLLAIHRLVTVTGPGGCGKTRLTLEVAADAAAEQPDGIWLVELSGVADAEHVADTILASVDVGEVVGVDAIDRLSAFLESRRALLVLDTCEHLVEAAADAAHRLLASCPRLGVVATSREPLGVTGEMVWRVPPMTVGEHGEGDGVALFVERASAVRSNFTLSESNQDAVSAICRRLDGIPLAIELAAARVRSLSIKDIAAGLDDRFRLLAGGSRTALARQRTLEASVQWSYELTDPEERAVLRRLAVFQSSFDLAAAEQVATGGDVDELAVLDVLGRLVDKSLVQMDESPTGDVRYSLLDTIRQFGRDRLAEAGEVDDALARHLAWLCDLCEAAEPALHRGDLATLARIDDQLDDVRVALAWAGSDPDRASAAVAIVGALGFYWLLRGRFREGIEWCRRSLAAAPDVPGEAERLRARWALADATFYGGEPGQAVEEAAALAADANAAGLPVFEARCRALLGLAVMYEDPEPGVAILDEAVTLALEARDDFTIIDNHHCRGFGHLFLADLAASAADFTAVRPLAERSGNGFHLGWDGAFRAWLALLAADPNEAEVAARAGQAAARRAGESNSDALATQYLCFALADRGRAEQALREIDVAVELFARRPGQLTEVCMAAARAYVLSSVEDDTGADLAARHCLVRSREGGFPFAGYGVLVTAAVLRRAGDFSAAQSALAEADEIIERGHRLFAVDTALERARLWRAIGEPDRAEDSAHAALAAAFETGFRRTVVVALEELTHLSAAAGSINDATRLLMACQAARRVIGLVPTAEERRWIDETTAAVVAHLGDPEDAAAAFAEGEQLSLEGAVAYVRRARGERGRPAAGWGSLTPTERQVVDLVVDGHSNPQIAERLFMSLGTVKAHLAHVFAKVGVSSRAELAAMATRRTGG